MPESEPALLPTTSTASRVRVAIVLHSSANSTRWMIRSVCHTAPQSGWARFDGTFTIGIYPDVEALNPYVVSSVYRDELIEFAEEQGWFVDEAAASWM